MQASCATPSSASDPSLTYLRKWADPSDVPSWTSCKKLVLRIAYICTCASSAPCIIRDGAMQGKDMNVGDSVCDKDKSKDVDHIMLRTEYSNGVMGM